MVARIQALVVFATLLAAGLCAIQGWQSATWRWGWPVVGLPVGYVVFVFAELLLQRSLCRRRGEMGPGLAGCVGATLRETVAAFRVFYWRQPFSSRAHADRLVNPRGIRGVVLIHGYYCNRGVWNSWTHSLDQLSVPFVAVNMEPPFISIDEYTGIIDQAVRRMTDATGREPILIGHSMGGTAARAWMMAFSGAARVHRIVTIGSPHAGTLLGRLSTAPNARQMSFRSSWLAALAAAESTANGHAANQFVCYYSVYDNVVVPASSACMVGADNRLIPGRAHLDLLDAPEIFAEVIRLAALPDTATRAAG